MQGHCVVVHPGTGKRLLRQSPEQELWVKHGGEVILRVEEWEKVVYELVDGEQLNNELGFVMESSL